jgi:16S rRNA (guanine966-N2)-methyltransferase
VRVIAGEARGVPLVAPAGAATRPTSDRVKGAIFSALGERGCAGLVADLFAGSGALGIEALSRGAEHCDFVESAAPACRAIRANLERTKLAGRARVICRPVDRFVLSQPLKAGPAAGSPGASYDLILLDPPYALPGLDDVLGAVATSPLAGAGTTIVVEHSSRRVLPDDLGPFRRVKMRRHGDGAFSIYVHRSLELT